MGLGLNPDGTVPRRIRGKKIGKPMPCLPHVSMIGEQIRMQMIRFTGGNLRRRYDAAREIYDAKFPDRPKMYNFKAALRHVQKLLYACLWAAWREGRGLEAPMPYPFIWLGHSQSSMLTISDFYDKE